jgi:ribosomal protein S18 acetylase RimI-like enzyme
MIEIRKANGDDLEVLTELNKEVQLLHAEAFPNLFKKTPKHSDVIDFFTKLLASENNHIYIALNELQIVGYVWCLYKEIDESAFTHKINKIHIEHLVVTSTQRNSGVGAQLLKEVESLGSELGVHQISLDVWSFNTEASQFYRSQNYEPYNNLLWKII